MKNCPKINKFFYNCIVVKLNYFSSDSSGSFALSLTFFITQNFARVFLNPIIKLENQVT